MSAPLDPTVPDVPVATQNQDTYYGCIPYEKTDTVVVAGGAPSTVEYQLKNSDGTPMDISYWFPADVAPEDQPHVLGVWFSFADNSITAKTYVTARVIEAAEGRIQFDLPSYVTNMPCIYYFYGAVAEKTANGTAGTVKHVCPGRGVLLVEWSPWILHVKDCPVKHRTVPTLEDVRRRLDDFIGKNDLLDQYEFTADDIVHAMIRPVYFFNEEPPRLRNFQFTLATFPFYDNWVQGTAAELMQIAVLHYTRNKLMSSHGGITGDEKGRDREYLQLAQMYRDEYRRWVTAKKRDLNFSMQQGWGTIHSPYAHLR